MTVESRRSGRSGSSSSRCPITFMRASSRATWPGPSRDRRRRPGGPAGHLDHFLQFRLADLRWIRRPPWLGRAMVADRGGGTRRIVGSIGFHGPPDADGRSRSATAWSRRTVASGWRQRGRARAVRLGAREHGVHASSRPSRRTTPLAAVVAPARLPPDGRPDGRHRRRGAGLRARRLAAGRGRCRAPPACSHMAVDAGGTGYHDRMPTPTATRFDTLAVHAGAEPDELTGAVSPPIYQTAPTPRTASDGRAAATSTRARRTRRASGSNAPSPRSRAAATASRSPPGRRSTAALAELAAPGRRDRRRRRRLRRDVPLPRARPARHRRRRPLRGPRRPVRTSCGRRSPSGRGWSGSRRRRTRTSRSSTSPRSRPTCARARPRAAGGRWSSSTTRSLAGAPAAAAARRGHRLPLRDEVPRPATRTRSWAWRSPRTTAVAERLRFLQNAMGAVPGPLDCFLVLRGLRTLHLRMERHGANARPRRVPARRPDVATVRYPGFGGMVSFVPAAGGPVRARPRRSGPSRSPRGPACSRSPSRSAASSRSSRSRPR